MNIPVPAWATHFVIHTNAIDGYPPRIAGEYRSLAALNENFDALRYGKGGGEWDVIVYALETTRRSVRAPYGPGNRYRVLKPVPRRGQILGSRVQVIAKWDYCNPLCSQAERRACDRPPFRQPRLPKTVRFTRAKLTK